MASLIREFVVETQARLGLVDTRAERAFWQGVRDAKLILRSRRRLVALATALLFCVGPILRAQTPVTDSAALAQRNSLALNEMRDTKMRNIYADSRQNMAWLSDLVNAYRQIKMAKATYESIATMDLASRISVVDVIPEISLPKGHLGSDKDYGVSEVGNIGDTKQSYLTLRFKEGGSGGGIVNTLTDWPKFQPKLKIDPKAIARQLANLDFDCVKMVQRVDASGNPVGPAVAGGRPEEAAGKVLEWFDKTLKAANNWPDYFKNKRAATDSINQMIADEANEFDRRVGDIRQQCDAEDLRARNLLRGSGILVNPPPASTYEVVVEPNVQVMEQFRQVRAALYKKALEVSFQKLEGLKKNNTTIETAAVNKAAMTKILAENEQSKLKAEEAFTQILNKYKVMRQDSGERGGNQAVGILTLKSTDLSDMKLPPAAQDEIIRLRYALLTELQQQQMKLTVLVESNKDLVLADGELNAVQQLQQKMLDDVKLMVDTNALLSWDETRRALADYEKFVKDTADRNREEEQRRARDVAANLAAANQKYFTHFGKKGVTSAAKVTEYLLKSYGDVVKAFFGGRTLSDVMGTSLGPVSDVDWAEEWKIYDKCGEGAGS